MATKGRRSRKNAVKKNLLFELYGILILTFSVIALAGQGHVGRTLLNVCFVIFGNPFGYLIPLIAIWIGLSIMIKRIWPKPWTMRNVGIGLFICCLAISHHVSFFNELFPDGDFTPGMVWRITWEAVTDAFAMESSDSNLIVGVGGGMVGAALFTILVFLFDILGTKMILVVLFIVAVILATGFSLVNFGEKLQNRFPGAGRKMRERFAAWVRDRFASAVSNRKQGKQAVVPAYTDQIHMDDEDEDEFDELPVAPAKKPNWLQRIQSEKFKRSTPASSNDPVDDDDEQERYDQYADEEVIYQAPDDSPEPMKPHADLSEEEPMPTILNFLDQQNDSVVEDEEEPPALSEAAEAAEGALGMEAGPDGEAAAEKPVVRIKPYELPSFSLLAKPQGGKGGDQTDFMANAKKLEATLESFGVRTKVLQVVRGPAVTRYEIQPDVGVKVSRIVSLTDDIALALAAKDIRMEAPIPGKSAIGIEVPNSEVSIVTLREVMETSAFQDSTSRLSITLGRDISGQPIVGNLAKMPHLLVAGATGSGKSVCVNGIITSILYKAKPNEVKFMMIDPKMVELNVYNGIPHLLAPVVTDPRRASLALKKIVSEMERRYDLFAKSGTRNIEGYNALLTEHSGEEPLPYIVVIVDELADLMMVAANDVEDAITRIAQMARAAGIHLIIATQRPSVDVITGVIKANIPSRIAFGVSSQVDSRTILDMVGAEKLLGRGDMLYLPVGASKPIRVQGAFLSDQEVEAVVSFVRSQEKAEYQEEMVPEVEETTDTVDEHEDELFDQAVQIVLEAKQASVSLLQRRMRIGYTRAARLIDYMEAKGIIGPYEGSKPREVLMSLEQYHHNRMSS